MKYKTGKEAADGGIFNCRYDKFFTLISADDSLFKFLGYSREEFAEQFDNHVLDAIYEGDREILLQEADRQFTANKVFRYENRLVVKGGWTRWVWVSAELVMGADGEEQLHCIFHDISREKRAQEQLEINEKRYDIILSHIQDIIFDLDCTTYSIYYSPNFKKKFGYEIPSQGFPDSMFSTDIIYEEDKPVLREHFQSLLKGQTDMECEYRIKSCDGSYIWVDVHATALRGAEGGLVKILGIISDIDQRKREIIKAQKEATSDPLTGLLNRRECISQIEAYMSSCHNPAAFMLIDVDNFKNINDTYGHLYGDSVLNEFANSLRTIFRRDDMIARIGGDEFVVFMTNVETGSIIEDKVKRIEAVSKTFAVKDGAAKSGCSIGISFYPGHGSDFRSLFAKADAAMYHVKKQGKGWFCIYGEDMAKTETADSDTPSRVMKKSFHDHIIEHVVRIFLENQDTGTAISILMNLVSRVFHADRIFIFERDDGRKLVNTYRFNSEEVTGWEDTSEYGAGQEIDGLPLRENLSVYLNTDQIEDPALRQWFADHGAMAAITCCMKADEEFSTVIIYEDCRGTRIASGEEQYTLLMISRIIHLFLIKENHAIQLQKQENIAERTLLENEIAHREMIYRTALRETHINVWEYDVKTHTLRLTESAEEHHGFRILGNVPESLMSGGYVHHRSSRDLLDMYQKLEDGQRHVQADILTRSADGNSWWWERIHYTMLFSPEGEPCCAVAIGEDITQQKKAEIIYQQELQLRMTFDSRMLASFRCNLDKNCVEYVEAHSRKNYPPGMTYERLMEIHNKTMANEEDMERLKVLMNRTALQQAYQNGTTSLTFEYRRKDENGSLSWVSATGRLLRDAESGDLYIYGTLEDINEKKNLELALKRRADYDTLTGVYNKDTAIQMIGDALAKVRKKNNSYSLLVFSVDGFTNLVRSSGYIAADRILKELASQLKIRFTSEKIIGRFYGDEFVAFFYNSPKPDLIWRDTEEVIKAMALPYMFPELGTPVSVFCGIVFDNHPETGFEELYRKAKTALDVAKTSEAGNIFIYNESRKGASDNRSVRMLPPPEAMNSAGNDSESETILLKCMFSLVSAADLRLPLEHTLQELAAYYGADRAYIAELESGRSRIREIYEWKKEELISIANTAERLYRAERMKKPEEDYRQLRYIEDIVCLKEAYPELFPVLKTLGISSCIFGILNEGGNPIGYIGIDNPQKHTDNTSILMAIRYFLSNELIKRRLQEKQEFLSYHDELTGVLNRNSYKEYRINLREEGLISLGVVSVDINGLKEINQNNGNAYGDSMIRIIAHIMETEYPAARVYRFSGDEFLLICENISQDSFNMRLNLMKSRLQEICSVSVGSAWADIDINLDFLISSADERRIIAKQAYYDEQQNSTMRRSAGVLKTLLDEIARNHFIVYLQPKINAQTNQLYGAEALVRYKDKKYGVISPGKFVPYLETVGLIHYIDFFVFEEVCRILKKWKECGFPQIPVSLNFSRATLLEENLIEKMEQIILRYGVDRSLVEIEITESLGEVARNTVAQIGNQIVQSGFHIVLDDFGTKYSNLSFLSLLHFHNLKLDKSLVNHLLANRSARIIVKNIVALCRELNVEVLAEGVENKEQLDVLKELQCFLVQGYYYSKPLPCMEFEEQYLEG